MSTTRGQPGRFEPVRPFFALSGGTAWPRIRGPSPSPSGRTFEHPYCHLWRAGPAWWLGVGADGSGGSVVAARRVALVWRLGLGEPEASGLVEGGLFVMAGFAEPASVGRVVGVESECLLLPAAVRVVVCDGGDCGVAEYADRISGEDRAPECLVPASGIATPGCGAPRFVGLSTVP